MPFCVADDVVARLSQYGAIQYLDDDNDGYLNAAEMARITDAIAYVDDIIRGRIEGCGGSVTSAGAVIKRMSIGLATYECCTRRGQDPAWAKDDAKEQWRLLDFICDGKLKVVGVALTPGAQQGAWEHVSQIV